MAIFIFLSKAQKGKNTLKFSHKTEDIQHNYIHHNDNRLNDTQHNDTQHIRLNCDTKHK
jgi:hypothetical protein